MVGEEVVEGRWVNKSTNKSWLAVPVVRGGYPVPRYYNGRCTWLLDAGPRYH